MCPPLSSGQLRLKQVLENYRFRRNSGNDAYGRQDGWLRKAGRGSAYLRQRNVLSNKNTAHIPILKNIGFAYAHVLQNEEVCSFGTYMKLERNIFRIELFQEYPIKIYIR